MSRLLRRALEILDLFTPDRPLLTLTQVSKLSGLAPSTTHRILSTLVETGHLEKGESTGEYSIGMGAYKVGILYLNVHGSMRTVDPVLDLLSELTGERIGLHVLDHSHSLVLTSRESTRMVRFTEPPGAHFWAHSTANGQALLSGLGHDGIAGLYPEEQLEQHTPGTIATRTELLRVLERVRETGAASVTGECILGVSAVAAPIRDIEGKVVASLSVAAPSSRIDEAMQSRLAELVRRAGGLASHRLGYRNSDRPTLTFEEIRSWWAENEGL
jgi:IclR family acetate operon transcriptional repressor